MKKPDRLVFRRARPRRFDLRAPVKALVRLRDKLPGLSLLGQWGYEASERLTRSHTRVFFRVAAVAFWALATIRVLTTVSAGGGVGGSGHINTISLLAIAGAGYLLGMFFWALPWGRLPIDHLLGSIVIGIGLPLVYLSFTGNLRSRDLLTVYIAAAVFTAALLPLRTAMAAALLGAIAAAIPLLAGWTAYYDRSLLVLVSVIGLLTYTQARMLGKVGLEKRDAEDRQRQIEESFMATVGALAASIFANDERQEAHSRGSANLAVVVARRMGLKGQALRHVEYAALLHDVGKIGIPGYVLNKTGPLSDRELDLVHKHPIVAERILSRVPSLKPISPIIRAQYERWNGSGFPDGLIGEAIPMGARILHACTAFNAMSTERTYRPALAHEDAARELRAQAGKQFDPRVVEALIDVFEKGEADRVEMRAPSTGSHASREWIQQLQTIEGLSTSLAQETSLGQICRVTAEVAASLIPHDQVRVYIFDRPTRTLQPAFMSMTSRSEFVGATTKTLRKAALDGLAARTLETRRGQVVSEAAPEEIGLSIQLTGLKLSAIAAPVMFKDEPLAVLEVVRVGSHQFSRNHLRLLRILAGQMALSVTNARLVERLAA